MKKNLISIVILALLIVNLAMTSITLISVTGTNRKTAALVTDIASAISLDLEPGTATEAEEAAASVAMENVVTYDISDLTIPLKRAEGDDKDHYALLSFTLSMNSKDDGYKKYGGDIESRESLIKGEINDVVSSYTVDEARENSHAIEEEILQRIQNMFDSEFIYAVRIISAVYQ
jgi:flagellar FliL protein